MNRKVRLSTAQYIAFEKVVDNLALDQAVRFKREAAPQRSWFERRSALNRFVIRLCRVDDDLVLLRVK